MWGEVSAAAPSPAYSGLLFAAFEVRPAILDLGYAANVSGFLLPAAHLRGRF